ncbi:MAG: hypothetical protein Q4B32_10260 [Clostridia bacterium]|nr:hypothetical protein [Clostridia bacterium]
MKKFLALILCLCIASSLFVVSALADDDVTIPAGKTAKAGSSLPKANSTDEPYLDIYEIAPGTTIKFWIYRNGKAQLSPTYTLSPRLDHDIRYNNSGNKKAGDKYHSVWKKTTQSQNTSTYVHFSFIP